MFGFSDESGFRKRHRRETEKRVSSNPTRQRGRPKNSTKEKKEDKEKIEYDKRLNALVKEYQYDMEEANIDTSKLPKHGHISKRIAMPKYGKVEPTLKVSTLNHHDWGVKIWGNHKFRWNLGYINRLENGLWTENRKAWQLPRFHGKTETVIKVGVRESVEKVLTRVYPYLMITNKFLRKRLFGMWRSYYLNRNFRLMYGDVVKVEGGRPQINKTEGTIEINDNYFQWGEKDPWVQIISKDQEAIGGHPARMHIEDILQKMPKGEDTIESLKQMIADDWFPMLSLEEGIDARATGTWTRKQLGDTYEYIRDFHGWELITEKAMRGSIPYESEYEWDADKNNITWIDPIAIERMDLLNPHQDPKRLLEIAIKTPATFASQYQNDPIKRGSGYYDSSNWIAIKPFDTSKLVVTGGCDPAIGEKASDFTCIMYQTWYKGNLIITDLFLEQNIGFNRVCNHNLQMYAKNNPNRFIMHNDRSDKAIVQNLRGKMPFQTYENKEEKTMKIDAFKEYEAVKKIYYFGDIPMQYIKEMKKQVDMYDRKKSTPTKHDDYLDIQVTLYQATKPRPKRNQPLSKTWNSKR